MPSPPAWLDDTSTHGPLFLIAAGTARYDHLPEEEQLPSVTGDLKRIVDLFTANLGYERFCPALVTIRRMLRSVASWEGG